MGGRGREGETQRRTRFKDGQPEAKAPEDGVIKRPEILEPARCTPVYLLQMYVCYRGMSVTEVCLCVSPPSRLSE